MGKEKIKIRRNVLLRGYNTFKIGGRAKYFFVAKKKADLFSAIEFAKKKKTPFFLLGGGSNILFPDKGINGLVIKIENRELEIENCDISSGAGVLLNKLVSISAEKSLTGLEWAAGIPGTLGGAIFGNAGWPSGKKNISSAIESVEVLETKPKLMIKEYKLRDCRFSYRDSVFKNKPELIILSAKLKLKNGNRGKIKRDISDILENRKKKIPFGFSAGSVFKNPSGRFAAKLVEGCGLKGKVIGGAKISEKHANFIINFNKASDSDIKKLINLAKKTVKRKFKVSLEEEIVIF